MLTVAPTPVAPTLIPGYRSVGAAVVVLSATPMVVSGATATVTVDADSGGSATVGTDVVVYGATASVTVSSPSGATVVMTGGLITVPGATAIVTVSCPIGATGILGTVLPGDSWQAPTQMTGLTYSTSWSSANYTIEGTEPASTATIYRSRWFVYSSGEGNVTFTASGSTDVQVDVFEAGFNLGDPDSWSLVSTDIGTSVTTAATYTTTNSPILVRVSTTADTTYTITFGLTVETLPVTDAADGTGMLLQVLEKEIDDTPDSVLFSLMGGPEEQTISLRISPDPLGWGEITTVLTDETGIVLGADVPLVDGLQPGVFQLIASGTLNGSTVTASDSFTVLYDPFTTPTAEPTDTAPAATAATRWVLQDRASVLAEHEFTYNPTTMSSPWAPRTYTTDATTAPDGQAMIWEAIERAVDWEFAGYIDTEADHDALLAYGALNRRFYVIDHRQRAWTCTFVSVDLQPRRVIGKPYAFDYTVKALIYGGPQ